MYLKRLLPKTFRNRLKLIPYQVRCFINMQALDRLLKEKVGLHIGCGDIRIPNLLNLDVRVTHATDIVHDSTLLEIFPNKTFPLVFSNAFFEHLYLPQRLPHLKEIKRVLTRKGTALYLGMPDFKIIAESYLENKAGILYSKFDTNEVYRYTHGNPEQAPSWWLEQLHKSLFDKKTLVKLLENSGFTHYSLFNYIFRNEKIPLNIGFIAFNDKPPKRITSEFIEVLAKKYTNDVSPGSIQIIFHK